MQIGLAKTPTMHGGIASAEVGFAQCTFLYYSHIHTCICLQCTSFYSLPMYIIVTHRKHKQYCTERGGEVCVISFLSCWFKIHYPWQWSAPNTKKGAIGRERGVTRAVCRVGEDANQERNFWALLVALLLMAVGNALHADFLHNWLTAILSWMHACAYANSPGLNHTCIHTHNQHNQVCEVKTFDSYICTHLEEKKKKVRKNPTHIPCTSSTMTDTDSAFA